MNESDLSLPPNWVIINTHVHLVRTQAGFRKACRVMKENGYEDEMKNLKIGGKIAYPAIVEFSSGYAGYWYMIASWTPINTFVTGKLGLLKLIADNDPETAKRLAGVLSS